VQSKYQKKIITKLLSIFIIAVMIISSLTVLAGENDDIISNTWMKITLTDGVYVVDSLNGIPAYYNLDGGGTYYQCSEFVSRYYSQLYNEYTRVSYSNYPPSNTIGNFTLTTSPSVGDIVYWPAVRRGKSYQHYALVKEVREGSLVLIEQNWAWNGQAALNRTVKFPSSNYDVWTLGSAAPVQTELYVSEPEPEVIIEPEVAVEPEVIAEPELEVIAVTETIELSNALFADISDESELVQESILFLADKNIMAGKGDGVFDPDAPITRAEIAAVLVRMLGKVEQTEDCIFTDVSKDSWYYHIANSAKNQGIMNGFEDGTFRGSDVIVKSQVVAMASRMLKNETGYTLSSDAYAILSAFSDADGIADWAVEDIAIAAESGIIAGDGTFGADNAISRGDAAVILYSLYNLM